MAEQRQQQLKNLTNYTTEIETLYKNINGFRHDYINLIISLETSIQNGDIKQIREIYNNVLKKSPNILNHDHHSLGVLSKIMIPAIKSLLSHKIIYALEKGIRIEIEIEQQWANCHMDTLDYIRILGILLDNAIEASENTANAFIHIAVIIDPLQKENRFIIENATTEETSAIHQLFKHSVTTKGNGHGTGLHNVQQILIDYEQAHLETAHANHKFSQTLVTQG
ncbi:sensor histidine kinase [Leuconostoc rapi]|uniref:sensor histidine kinase n=1 Tax=Leuconostoc rapi TaxID=1406906 RepID=UPI001EF88E3C|nr:GHKL domain-containing protein [Leuconostoc rapi]